MSNEQWILIIDDEKDLAHLMETVLHKEGLANIVTAGTLADGARSKSLIPLLSYSISYGSCFSANRINGFLPFEIR